MFIINGFAIEIITSFVHIFRYDLICLVTAPFYLQRHIIYFCFRLSTQTAFTAFCGAETWQLVAFQMMVC